MPVENSPPDNTTADRLYRNILVPTDGSAGAQLAADHAIAIAKAFDGKVHAMSVDEGAGSEHRDHLRTDSEEVATKATERVAEKAEASGVPVTTSVQSGTPEQAIVSYAEESDTDLVVMGTHGRTGLENVIFGSVAEETVRKSSIPVLTVHPPEDETDQ